MALFDAPPIPPDQIANVGSTVTIEELESTTAGKAARLLVLAGGGLPGMEQADWGGDSNVVTTWYPGNGIEASQQMLGPTELPSQWAGEWNRTRLGRTPCYLRDENGATSQIIDPGRLWELMDDFRIVGVRLRVTWSVKGRELVGLAGNVDVAVDFQVVREGRLKSFKVQPSRHTDMKWTAEFHWASRGRRQDRVVSTRSDADLAQATSAVSNSLAALDDLVNSKVRSINSLVRKSATTLSIGQLESMANAPLAAVNRAMAKVRYDVGQLKRIGNIANKLASAPEAIANSVKATARDVKAVAKQFRAEMGRTPLEVLSKRQTVSDMLRARKYFGKIEDGMAASAKASSDLELRLRQSKVSGANQGAVGIQDSATTRAGAIVAVHSCRTGDTPVRISVRYYGNADQVEAILRANKLPLHTPAFRPGQIIVIPALANAPRKG